jgi:hypothetical protein
MEQRAGGTPVAFLVRTARRLFEGKVLVNVRERAPAA